MEDRNKPKAHRAAGDAESIVELTLDMELPEDSDVRIIDLTDAIDGPVGVPATAPPAETFPETETTAPPAPTEREAPGVIEQEVDAAFDAVQAPVQETAPVQKSIDYDEKMIDRLSDLPRMVDKTLEMADSADTRMEKIAADKAEPIEPPELDAGDIAATAAEMDSAIAGSGQDDEEIILLTEIVDPAQIQPADFQEDNGDDEIIELTDIVDPAELQVGAVIEARDDEQILELTDIVDPAELETAPAHAAPPEQNGDLADHEMTGKSNIIADRTADEPGIEEVPVDSQSLPENLVSEPAVDPIALDAIAPFEDDPQHQESVIRLSDVLSHDLPKDERPPIEQMKMGAEEELAKQTISLEAEETANALGLDLEKETREEGKPLTDPEIEAAIERIILNKYAETIEQLIAKAVEKAVSREIENIKRAIMDGDEPLT